MTPHTPSDPVPSPPHPGEPSAGRPGPRPPRRRPSSPGKQGSGYGPCPPTEADAAIGGLADVVAMVPHRMGFHPRNSLVAVLLDAEGVWMATARHDVKPRVSLERLVHWLSDVGQEAHSLIAGVYSEDPAARDVAEELCARVPDVCVAFAVQESAWFALQPGQGWVQRRVEELWESPLQLEALASGSAPGIGAPAHPLEEPSPRLLGEWQLACVRRGAQLDGIAALAADIESMQESSEDMEEATRLLRRLTELGPRAMTAWARVLGLIELRGSLEDFTVVELEDLTVALHSLALPGVRDLLLVSSACPDLDAPEGEVLLGEWEGPVDAEGLGELRRVLEAAALLLEPALRAEAVCLLAWTDWARGRGSVAGATLDRVEELVPGHRLAGLLRAYLDQGLVPRWLRPSHGGLGAR